MFNDHGEPVGAQITNYLLEKGRVVGQIQNERDFHIFYQFTKGASDEQRGQSFLLTQILVETKSAHSRDVRVAGPRSVRVHQLEQLPRCPRHR